MDDDKAREAWDDWCDACREGRERDADRAWDRYLGIIGEAAEPNPALLAELGLASEAA